MQPLTSGKQRGNGRKKCEASSRSKGQPDTSVVNKTRSHLNVRGQVLYGGNGVSNLLDNLAQRQWRGSANVSSHTDAPFEGCYFPFVWYSTQGLRKA